MLEGFLATVLTVTFQKLQWEAGSVTLADILASVFLVRSRGTGCERRPAAPPNCPGRARVHAAFLLVYLAGYYNLQTTRRSRSSKGIVKFGSTSGS